MVLVASSLHTLDAAVEHYALERDGGVEDLRFDDWDIHARRRSDFEAKNNSGVPAADEIQGEKG